jgi:hypothetical protein
MRKSRVVAIKCLELCIVEEVGRTIMKIRQRRGLMVTMMKTQRSLTS